LLLCVSISVYLLAGVVGTRFGGVVAVSCKQMVHLKGRAFFARGDGRSARGSGRVNPTPCGCKDCHRRACSKINAYFGCRQGADAQSQAPVKKKKSRWGVHAHGYSHNQLPNAAAAELAVVGSSSIRKSCDCSLFCGRRRQRVTSQSPNQQRLRQYARVAGNCLGRLEYPTLLGPWTHH
jgi:hypothetical protein